MQEKSKSNNNFFNFNFKCIGICHRLFNFILSLTRGLKRVSTTCHPMRQGSSTSVPILTSVGQPNRFQVELHKAQIHEAHETGPIRKESVEELERIRERKGKSVVIVNSENEEYERGVKLQNCPSPRSLRQRQVRPLFDVAANINEKSDAFIRSRKEAMRRNYTFDMEICDFY